MTTTFQPGYAAQLKIGTTDTVIGPLAANADLSFGSNPLTKPLIGAAAAKAVAGQASGTFSADGHTTEENIAGLHSLMEPANASVEVEMTYNGTGDKVAFTLIVGPVGITVAGDGEVDYSVSGTIDGLPVFTPGT